MLSRGERSLTQTGYDSSGARLVPAGAVIVSSRAPIGYVAIAGADLSTNQGCKTAVPPNYIDSRYLYWFLTAAKNDLVARASGTTFKEVSGRTFGETKFWWPSFDEQLGIVEILETHLSRLDEGARLASRIEKRLEAFLASSISSALAAAGGSVATLDSLTNDLSNGIFVSRAGSEQIGVPILRINAVRPLELHLDAIGYSRLSELEVQNRNADLKAGDLLFTRYNGNPNYVGAAAVVPEGTGALTYPDKLIRVRVDRERVTPEFVALASAYGASRLEIQSKVKTTAGQAGISGRELRSVKFRIPTVKAQLDVVNQSTSALSTGRRLHNHIAIIQARAVSLRRSLLAAAFSGQLTGATSDIERVEELAEAGI